MNRLLGLALDLPVLGLVFCLTLLTYNRDRLADYTGRDDQMNMKQRTQWIARHYRTLAALTTGTAVGAVVLLALRPAALPPILAGLGFALVYSGRILPGGRAPKQLPGLKVPYVAALWALLSVGIPLAAAGGPWNGRTALVTVAFFCFAAALVNLNDIRDIKGDRAVDTITIPVLWGEYPARLVSVGLAGLAGAAALGLQSAGLLFIALYVVVLALTYREDTDGLFRWLIEGIGLLTWPVAI